MTPGRMDRLKPYFKPRPRGQAAAPAQQPPPAAAPAPPAAAPPATASPDGLAERRSVLALRYAELQSDLGGLVYEMAARDHFRLDVVVRRAAELQAVDRELTAVEQALGLVARAPQAGTCANCGMPATPGAAFCGSCGAPLRPATTPPPGAPR